MPPNTISLVKKLQSGDNKVIVSVLVYLRNYVGDKKSNFTIDNESFKLIVSFLRMPNYKLINYSVSILANCCVRDEYRRMYKETDGCHDLVYLLRTLDHDDIACRAWRLVGNLASSLDLCNLLISNDIQERVGHFLDQVDDISAGTRAMLFRAIGKLWAYPSGRTKMLTPEVLASLKKCLVSKDAGTVQHTLQLFLLILSKPNSFNIDKPFLISLVELCKKPEFHELSFKCLVAFVTVNWAANLLEGTGISEAFISHLENGSDIDRKVLEGFYVLCTEGGFRNKVKTAGMLPKLIRLCHGPHVSLLLKILTQFQYDLSTITELGQSQEFLEICVSNIASNHAAHLLTVIVRALETPVFYFIKSIDIFISSPNCRKLLTTLIRSQNYFWWIVLSGRVWQLSSMVSGIDDLASNGPIEGLLEHYLRMGDDQQKRAVALAVPFLVKPRNFQLLYKFLAKHGAMNIILQTLDDNPTEDDVVSTIVRLAAIFRENEKNGHKSSVRTLNPDYTVDSNALYLEEPCSEVEEPTTEAVAATNVQLQEEASCEVGPSLNLGSEASHQKGSPSKTDLEKPDSIFSSEALYVGDSSGKVEQLKPESIVDSKLSSPKEPPCLFDEQKPESTTFSNGLHKNGSGCDNVKVDPVVESDPYLNQISNAMEWIPEESEEFVTFELDGGTSVTGPKNLLIAHSPVLDAMLTGHFAEAGQDRVKLRECSRRALFALIMLLQGKMDTSELDIHTHLELVSLADRLLIPALADRVTREVPLTGPNCAQVYSWAYNAGSTENTVRLRARSCWSILSSAEQLKPALMLPESRKHLLSDIRSFLTSCVNDLL